MNTKITLFIIISLILVIPSTSAQEINIGEKAVQKSQHAVSQVQRRLLPGPTRDL